MVGSYLLYNELHDNGLMPDWGLMSKRKGTVSKQIVLTQSHLTS